MPDTDKPAEPHLYGTADDSNRTPRAPQGMRGENNDTLAPPDPELAHEEVVVGGRKILINEANGVGFAEATGKAGLEAQHAHQEQHKDDD